MLDRWLFAARAYLLDIDAHIGSWRLSVGCMLVAALYNTLLIAWARSSSTAVVHNIAALTPFWIVYGLLLANTAVCLWRRLPKLRRDIARGETMTASPPSWTLEAASWTEADAAERRLRALGFGVSRRDDGSVFALRRRFTALGTYLFHASFFLIAIGFLTSYSAHQEEKAWVAVGEAYQDLPEQVLARTAPRVLAGDTRATPFTVHGITPEFWRDELLFTHLEADIELAGGERATTRINRPLWLGGGDFLRLSGFGYAPRYELFDRDGRVLDTAFVKLNVFPPGRRDHFRLPGYPHRFYLTVLPDVVEGDGEPTTRSLDAVNPGFDLRVVRGRVPLGDALLHLSEPFEFEGLGLRFAELRYWGEFTIVRDPGVPLVFLGYTLALAGLALKQGGERAEAIWSPGAGGPATIRGWGGAAPPTWAAG